MLGAYELVFGLSLRVHPDQDVTRRASITGARVTVKAGGRSEPLGFARPEGPLDIRPKPSPSTMTPDLVLPLSPGQMTALEEMRGAGDVDFELVTTGTGIDQQGEHPIQGTWGVHVPRSHWTKKLRQAGARNILLVEVPLPLAARSKDPIANGLRRAEEHLRNGEYHDCVAACRMVLQEMGYRKFKRKEWYLPLLDRLAKDRRGMTKDEREGALWAALRHYTHQAHHARSEGGVTTYSRAEAERVLALTASFVAKRT